jgi:hypothetical protein
LDKIAAANDRVLLSLPRREVREKSELAKELAYLIDEKGYRWLNKWALGK